MNSYQMMFYWFSRIFLGYKEALWPEKLEIRLASQYLTNDCQILVLSNSYLITTVPFQPTFMEMSY